jgi:hypothetical protein
MTLADIFPFPPGGGYLSIHSTYKPFNI